MSRLAITGATVIDTAGSTPRPERSDIIIEDGKVAELAKPGTPITGQVIDASGLWAIPGLMDLHYHPYMIDNDPSVPRYMHTLALNVHLALNALNVWLDSGVTTLRSAGAHQDLDLDMRDLLKAGRVRGPRMLASGPCIAMTSGLRMGNELVAVEVSGPDEARQAARRQIKVGSDWVKIYASSSVGGGGGRLMGPPGWPQLNEEEIRAIVVECDNAGVPTLAHANSAAAVKNVVRAGVTCVEHATHLDDECISLLLERGVPIVPTQTIGWSLATFGVERGFGEHIARMAAMQQKASWDSMMLAKNAGIPIGTGTDADNTRCLVREECRLMVEAGFTPYEALQSATVVSAEILGRRRDLGSLEPGRIADVVLLGADPLADIRNLADVRYVVQDGIIRFPRDCSQA